jgi:hypothetical protein
MLQRKQHNRALVGCLRALEDIIEVLPLPDALREIEAALKSVRDRVRQGESSRAKRSRSSPELTTNVVESQAEAESQSQLSVSEFGRNILSDDEFPTMESLVSFAREHGVVASHRETKRSLRRKLMSKAELRNMDDLMRSDER